MKTEKSDVVVQLKRGRYIARIPRLGLCAAGQSVLHAVRAVETKQQALQDQLASTGACNARSAPVQLRQFPILSGVLLSAIKGGVILILLLYAGAYVERVVEDKLDQVRKIGGPALWSEVENGLQAAADLQNDIPAAKKQDLLANIHVVVARWRPFIREAQTLLSEADGRRSAGEMGENRGGNERP